jgi:hypothetical protein
MEKPEEMPQWAWDKAREAIPPVYFKWEGMSPALHVLQVGIARAILSAVEEERSGASAEVEAMADALYEKADSEGVSGRDSAFAAWVTQNIATTIRNRKGA